MVSKLGDVRVQKQERKSDVYAHRHGKCLSFGDVDLIFNRSSLLVNSQVIFHRVIVKSES
jgi:hypothetical protein